MAREVLGPAAAATEVARPAAEVVAVAAAYETGGDEVGPDGSGAAEAAGWAAPCSG